MSISLMIVRVLVLAFVTVAVVVASVPSAFSQSEEAPEVELYQDGSGQWKIRYLNDKIPAEEPAALPSQSAQGLQQDQIEVELYQDDSGEWMVRYFTKESAQGLAAEEDIKEDPRIGAEDKTVAPSETVAVKPVVKADVKAPVTLGKSATKVQKRFQEEQPDIIAAPDEEPPSVMPRPFKDADRPVYGPVDEQTGRSPNHRWEFGFDYRFYEYEQESVLNNIDEAIAKSNDGTLGGIHLGYEYVSPNQNTYHSFSDFIKNINNVSRYRISLDYNLGQTEYSDISGSSEQEFTQHLVEAKAVGGYDFNLGGKTRLTPFMGLGYRYLNDSSGGVVDVSSGIILDDNSDIFVSFSPDTRKQYTTETHYFYLPVGLMTNSEILPDLHFGLNLEFDYVLLGIHKSSFSDLGDLYVELTGDRTLKLLDMTNRLDGGIGLKGSARVTKKNRMFDWYVEPYIRYWHVNESDTEQYEMIATDESEINLERLSDGQPAIWAEPENSTTEYGIQIGFVY